jgi:hypothetical protein
MSPADLIAYVRQMPMDTSYQMVCVLTLVSFADPTGSVRTPVFMQQVRNYYIGRSNSYLTGERPDSKFSSPASISDADAWTILKSNPLPALNRAGFVHFDDQTVRFPQTLWLKMTAADMAALREAAIERLEAYFEAL